MKNLGVSKKSQRWGEKKIRSDSEWVVETQRRLRELVRFEHIDLNIYTSGQVLNAVHTAVTNGLDRWEKYLHYQIPVGMTARLVLQTPMRYKLYATAGTEQGRNVEMMLALGKVGKSLPVEICRLKYSTWFDHAWLSQLNRDVRESLIIDLGYSTEVLFWEGEQIQFWVKNSSIDIPSTPHANTLIAYPCQVITNADLQRQIEKIKKQIMAERGIDAAD